MTKRIRRDYFKPLAIYSSDLEGFLCQLCSKTSNLVWLDWEIPRHLNDHRSHNLDRAERFQRIIGWNEKCERSYRKNINKPIRNPPPIHFFKKKTKKESEEDRKRSLMELQARRED
jgi:hypothetical protein